jgi:hypothetical protein
MGRLILGQSMGLAFSGRLHYNIYINSGSGGPVDYSDPIGAVMTTTWTTSGLAAPGTWSFGVRAADGNGEEENLDCAVTIVLDASGNDISARPAPPIGLRAFPLAGGAVRVEWYYTPVRESAPVGFNVYLGPGVTPNYATPTAVVAYGSGRFNTFVADLLGLTDGMAYSIGVRAFNASGEEANTTSAGVTADATGPLPVDLLIATAIV